MRRIREDALLDKRRALAAAERQGTVADSLDVRKQLLARVKSGEMTLLEVQTELKRIKRNAKRNGLITRSQAWRRG